MTCDKSKAVSGDVVTVRGEIIASNQHAVNINFGRPIGGGCTYISWVPRECIVAIEEKPLQVGDVVALSGSRHDWTILAIRERKAWITREDANHIVTLAELRRAH